MCWVGCVGRLSECAWLISVLERTVNLDTRIAKPTVLIIGASGVVLTYFHSPIIFFCLPLSERRHNIY